MSDTLKPETANEVSAFDAAAIRNEMGRIRALFEDRGGADAEDLISYARHVVELRTAARTPPTQVGDDVVEREIFELLNRKYVQRADALDRASGLQYMTAETHDLAKVIASSLPATRSGYDERLLEALRPFDNALAEWGDEPEHQDSFNLWNHPVAMNLTLGDLRRAHKALSAHQEDGRHE